MTTASIVNKRRFTPSIDRSDATIPFTPTVVSDAAELAARLIRRKASQDADRLIAMLGIEVGS